MRVLIDGSHLMVSRGTGVATYARGLARGLRQAGGEVEILYGRPWSGGDDALLREVEFYDAVGEKPARGWPARLRRGLSLGKMFHTARPQAVPRGEVVTRGWDPDVSLADRQWNRANLFALARARQRLTGGAVRVSNAEIGADLAHWAYPLPLRLSGVPNVVTLHDLVPLRLPYATLDRKRDYLRLVRWVAATAELIVTVSEASKRDIVELLGVDEARVVVTYQPVELPREEPGEAAVAQMLGRRGLEPGGYLLAYGAAEPKKNLGRVIEAYLEADPGLPLILAGPRGWLWKRELAWLEGRRMRRWGRREVRRLPYVDRRELDALIRGARGVVFASLYEGFGLPIVEAFARGTAVLTSDRGATAEVAGGEEGGAVLVDPCDVGSIAMGLGRLVADGAERAERIERGRARLAVFSEAACRGRLLEGYARLGVGPGRGGGGSRSS